MPTCERCSDVALEKINGQSAFRYIFVLLKAKALIPINLLQCKGAFLPTVQSILRILAVHHASRVAQCYGREKKIFEPANYFLVSCSARRGAGNAKL